LNTLIDESMLLAELKLGKPGAAEKAVSLHHGFLLMMVKPLVGEDLANDVVQNTWIKALAAIHSFEGRSLFRTWLTRIALNEAKALIRKHRREVSLESWGGDSGSPIADRFKESGAWQTLPYTWHHETPDALLTEAELHECIKKHLHKLPDDQRGVVILREMSGLGFDEIAAELSLSEGNIRVLLHRARQKMHVMLNHFEEEGSC
jgi:RNA polymerase sigma-70 factor (ECF subfamily)